MTDEELDAAVDIIAAVNAGIMESLSQRIKQKKGKQDDRMMGDRE